MMINADSGKSVHWTKKEDLERIWSWNEDVPEAVDALVHDMIDNRVDSQPEAPAVCAWDGNLTYGDLDNLSYGLANHLAAIGVQPNTIVPLCFEKSMWTVVAILGVLKAGGGFVLLDPTQPLKRLQAILQQVNAKYLCSSAKNVEMLSSLSERIVVIDRKAIGEMENAKPPSNWPSASHTTNLYIVFTSGSTGTPKGVVVTHGNFMTAFKHQASALGFDSRSRVFDFSSYSFEVTIHNTLATLCAGGCVCVPSESERRTNISGAMEKMSVNLANFTPTVSRLVAPKDVPSLKTLILIGEPMTEADGKTWAQHVRLVNAYGPAECTMLSTANLKITDWSEALSIGRGLGAVTWVVDPEDYNILLPIGAIGELLIEGPIVGAGYLHDTERTNKAFIRDPAWLLKRPSQRVGRHSRLYRTGDLVQYDVEGGLNFIGRRDSQVKIRGQRVELSEVESHVWRELTAAGISTSVVAELVTPLGKADPVLAAFISVSSNKEKPIEKANETLKLAIEKLEERLIGLVPVYMIPTTYVPIQGFPTTATGKTDRRQLREIGESMTMEQLAALTPSVSERRSPETSMERALQELWAGVLGVESGCINAGDSFLRLGGDSIRAMRLVGVAREKGLLLTVAAIFEHPCLYDLAKRIKLDNGNSDTTIERFSLLKHDFDIQDSRTQAASLCNVDGRKIEDIFPCTPLQEGLIAITAKHPGDYVARLIFKLNEKIIDLDRLIGAWKELAAAVAILRTRIIDLPRQGLVQVVIQEPLCCTKVCKNLQHYLECDEEQSIGLGTPLNWLSIVKDNDKCFAVWTIHHALYDGWSLPLMLRNVERFYLGAPQPRQHPFQSFVRYVLEMNREHADSYWKAQLASCEAVVFPELPQPINERQANRLMERCINIQWPRGDSTASTIIRAAWSLLIARYTDSEDVVFGATVTGRQAPVPGVETILGPTIVTVPVRVVLDLSSSVESLLQQIQSQALKMVAFEQTGLQQIRRIDPEVERGSQFQTLLVIQPPEQEEGINQDERLFESIDSNTDGTNGFSAFSTYAITAICQLKTSGLDLQIGFDSNVISEIQACRLASQLESILHQLCADANQIIGEVKAASDQDLEQIWEWNAIVPASLEACVHDLIIDRAQRQPSAPAVCAWNGNLTYGELDRLSTRLAYHLAELGVTPEQVIPLCFEKSVWTPVAMLGIMKVGAASIALDVMMPEDRLRAVVWQVKPRIVLSSIQSSGLAQRLVHDITKLIVAEEYIGAPITAPKTLPKVDPSYTVYIVFTSGSTGIPKGVIISHRNLSSAIWHQEATSYINKTSRVFDFASYAFDMAWINFVKTAVYGGCLCIPSETDRTGNIAASINSMRVNFAHLTPGVARIIKPSTMPSLSVLSQGGEPLSPEDISNWGPYITLHTGYGPAECTPSATLRKIDSQTHIKNIGRGQGLITWVVCSDGQQLAPMGAIGELWLEGPLVGQGYLNNPEKTADAFVEDPPWLLAGRGSGQAGRHGRLYRTGDLVRYDVDGTLIFIGRRDSQVKIRGQRVELGEVENHVRRALAEGGIRASVVAELIITKESRSATLVSFLCVGEGAEPSEAERQAAVNKKTARLEEELAEVLPGYMVPSAYIAIENIPVTATGKTDRRRLREMGQTFVREQIIADKQREHLPADNSLQKNIQDIWAEVLNVTVESISMDSAFTGLGGDSITAMQVVSRCRVRNIAVAVGDILRLQTIQKLSTHCKPVLSTPLIANEEADGRTWILSPIQQGFFNAHPRGLNHFNQSFLLKLNSAVSATAVAAALLALITRHPMLRARFHRSDEGTWEQYTAQSSPQAFSFAEHSLERKIEIHRIAQSRQENLNISEGPVFAADLFNIKAEAQALLLSAHHLVVDLVSWRIIWHDIEQCLTGGVLLPKEMVSFQTWCKLQQEKSQSLLPEQVLPATVEAPQIHYWGTIPQGNIYGECQQYTERIEKETTTLLLGRSNASFRTEPVDILLATLIHSFRQAFHDRHVPAVFLEGHGREPVDGVELDLSETVGWFTTLHPLQVPNNVENTLLGIIKSVKDLRRQVPGKGQPYFAGRYYSLACRKEFEGHDMIELLFNYSGLYQQLESEESLIEREDRPEIVRDFIEVSPNARRMALIVASAGIEKGETSISLEVNSHMEHQMRLQRWSALWGASLKAATRSLADRPTNFTLSDFPLLSLSYAGLESFIGVQLAGLGVQVDDIQDIYPCTPLQEGIVLSTHKGSATYKNHWIWECVPTGSVVKVSPRQLEAAWRCTASRHSILSTIFVNHPESGSFVQILLRDPTPKVVHMDCGSSYAAETLQRIGRPSFSTGEPEHALTICRASSSGEVACRLDISHALFDAASVPVLARDFARAYSGNTLSAAPSFREVVQHLERTPRSARLAYWRRYLANTKVCKLPSFQPARGHIRQGNSCGQLMIPASATKAVGEFCKRRQITRSVFLQVSWALVLSQHTGMDEICYGYLASGRDAPIDQIEELVGPLINMLVSRVNLSQPLEKVVATTQEHSIEHLAHQHISLAEIQHELGLEGQQLFNTIMTVREAHDYEGDTIEKIRFRYVDGEDGDEFDMLLDVGLAGTNTEVSLAYRKDFMSDYSAQEIGWTLEAAIKYLLSTIDNPIPAKNRDHRLNSDPNTRQHLTSPLPNFPASVPATFPAHNGFFNYVVGADEDSTIVFWQEQFKALKAQPFPTLPSPSYQPQANEGLTWWIDGFQCCDGEFTASTMIRAAWSILLAMYTDASEAIFGATLCGRQETRTKGESAVGPKPVIAPEQMSRLVTTTVPVRVIIDNNKTVEQFLLQVQEQAGKMARFSRMGLPRIRRVSADADRATQFQTIIVEEPVEEKSESSRANTHDTVWPGCSNAYAIIIKYRHEEQGLRLAISFDLGLVENEQIRKMAQQLEHVLRQACAPENAARRLAEVETVSEQDLREIWSWNATVPEAVEACVHDRIADMASKQPDAPAVHAWDGKLTYGELDERSTRLAYHLVRLGMSPGMITPLCFEKSIWTPVAMLGVMKAGGASVAMDVTQPQDRLRLIVQQVKPRFILSSKKEQDLAHRLADYITVVMVDQGLEQYLEASIYSHGRITLPRIHASCPLYVVFTSGSTGMPKGVVISHQNLSSAIVEQQATSGIEKSSRVYDFASYAFDMAWANFLKTMAYGGCLCVPSEADRKEIVTSMNALEVNFSHLTPGVARIIKSSAIPIPSLTTVSQGGEPLLQEDFSNWAPYINLHTGYGPAECTPSATLLHIEDAQSHNSKNIGRGQGLVTWVVRSDGQQLAPMGALGELWLEGPLVGEGYLNDPEKTAAAFIKDPPWLLRGSSIHGGRRGRLYRTGDLVHYHADGSLIFMGRKDSQVKIRGQRVELAEVENHVRSGLARQGISANVLAELIRPIGKADAVLAAFISTSQARVEAFNGEQPENEGELTIKVSSTLSGAIGALEEKLKGQIPAYMIPTVFVPLSRLPLTVSGKIDRRRVRDVGEAMTLDQLAALVPSPEESGERRQPETVMERELQGLWASVLGIEASTISAADSFLRLGGDSIQAMRLVAIAHEKGVSITVANIFKHPRLCDLAIQVKRSRSFKKLVIDPFSLLQRNLDIGSITERAAVLCGVDQQHIEDIFPCTPLQEGLIAMTTRRSGDYVNRLVFEVNEGIDMDRLVNAWQDLVATVPILRTRIIDLTEQGLVQVIVKEPLRHVKGFRDLQQYLEHDKQSQIGLGQPLSWIGTVTDSVCSKSLVVWTIHHALYDGWSLPLMLEEVERFYYRIPQQCQQFSFQSFVQHVLEINEEQAYSYWRAQLAGCEAATFPELPQVSYQPRADQIINYQIANLEWIPKDFTASTIIRTAWALLLARYTSSNEALFGVTVMGRQAAVPGINKIMGPTLATVPVRVVLSDTSIEELLHQTQSQALQMTAFEQIGLQRIRRISSQVEQYSQFQTLLVIQPREQGDITTDTVNNGKKILKPFEDTITDTQNGIDVFNTYAMMLTCQPRASGLDLQISFDSAVVSVAQTYRFARQLERILQQLCTTTPQAMKVNQIATTSAQDLQDIWNWNATVPEALEASIHDLVSARAQQQPSALALHGWDGDLTYVELDSRSTRLAYHLVKLGLKAGQIVPLCFEKSVWMPVAMLGVLKAGGVCVPLDIATPWIRLQTIARDVSANILMLAPELASQFNGEMAHIITDLKSVTQQWISTEVSLSRVKPSDLAFVMFTSGSTGHPKGVALEHAAICTSIQAQTKAINITQRSRYFQFASYSFDVSMGDIFATLFQGGTVCVPSEQDRVVNLAQAINSLRVNQACLTPTVAAHLDPGLVPTLENLTLGGEAMTESNIRTWAGLVQLRNIYGPVECSIWCMITGKVPSGGIPSNIGRAMGCVSWVVAADDHNRLAPVGATGELLIEGPILAQRYLNDPGKTATVFIEDPPWLLAGRPGRAGRRGRLYKTGDLVRYQSDGTLIFVGRKDTQVKIRGQRVELGEIEHHIQQRLPEGSQVIAEVIKPAKDESILAAFVKIDYGKIQECQESGEVRDKIDERQAAQKYLSMRTNDLTGELSEELPYYMIPSVYVAITAIPLTVSGKVNRTKVREIGTTMTIEKLAELYVTESHKRAPTTEIEHILQRLWSKTLRMPEASIGADDSFFQLGGDSIKGMKLVSAARRQGLLFKVADIFHRPRLCDIALITTRIASDEKNKAEVLPFALLGPQAAVKDIRADVAQQCGVEINQIEDIYPCTALQEGFMALSAKRIGTQVAQHIVKLSVTVSLARIRAAWEAVVASSAILRTRIVHVEGHGLVQAVLNQRVSWMTANSLKDYLVNDIRRPMELTTPLTRLTTIEDEVTTGRQYIVWTAHHAIYDAWSMGLILKRVAQIYHREQNQVYQIPSYKGFLKYIADIDRLAASAFWRSELEGIEAPIFPILPKYGYQPRADTTVEHYIELSTQTKTDPGITTATLIRAAWSIVLKQLSGSSDVVFGMTATGRGTPIAGIEDIEGPTLATFPVRIQIDEDITTNNFLQTIQAQAAALMAYEQLGLHNIRHLSNDTATACDFQSLLVIQPQEPPDELEELQVVDNDSDQDLSYFSTNLMMLVCHLMSEGFTIQACFDAHIIDRLQMQNILGQLESAIRGLATAKEGQVKLRELDCLDLESKSQIWQWNKAVPATVKAYIHEIIGEQCRARPEAKAILSWDGELTYRELDERSTRLAKLMASSSIVGPEVIIPLCFEKSIWTVVAMFAVMKTGGAFLLLDPSQPEARLRVIISQVNARLVLSSARNKAMSLKLASDIIVVSSTALERLQNTPKKLQGASETLQEVPERLQDVLPGLAPRQLSPENMLYVVFTSGSTGTPKGVVITHASYASAAHHRAPLLGFDHTIRMLDFASYSFDVAIDCILATLCHGGCLCIPSDSDRSNNLAEIIRGMKVNTASLTPTVARLLTPEAVPNLLSLQLAGEPISNRDIDMWANQLCLINGYGPAECSSIPCVYNVSIAAGSLATNIGKGSGSVTWVVDPANHERLLPIGAIGELLIEGPAVSRGYLNNSDKTRAMFIENPQWLLMGGGGPDQPGRQGRLYKTGDLVKYQSDGTLLFIGRKDSQTKLRGQRIELGEVEYYIEQQLPEVSRVAAEVIIPAGGAGDPTLAAFVSIKGEAYGSSDNVRRDTTQKYLATKQAWLTRMLGEVLPRYMVPSVYIPITKIPLLLSGKINRTRLREIGASITVEELAALRAAEAITKRAPTTPIERIIRRLWSSILEVNEESIGIDDSFFQLGGDSIGAMKLAAVARQQGLLVTVADIFHQPKVCDLALIMRNTAPNDENEILPFSLLGQDAPVKKIQAEAAKQCGVLPEQVEDIYPCTALQEGLMALSTKSTGAYIAQNVFNLSRMTLKLDQVRAAWDAVIASSAILRTRIIQLEGYGLMQVVLDKSLNYSWTTANSLGDYLADEERRPIELARPLVRLAVIDDLATSQLYIVWTVHHALYDGWSMGLILRRLAKIYRGERVGQSPSYKNFIKYIGDLDQAAADAYWRTELQGVEKPAFPILPSYSYQRQADSVVRRHIEATPRTGSGITAAILIRTAWAIVLKRLSGSIDIVFGVTVTGRNAPIAGIGEVEGPTFATLPARIRVDEDITVASLLQAVQTQAAASIAYEQVGLQNIRRLSDDAAAACDFQSLLIIQPEEEEDHQILSREDDMGYGLSYFNTYAITLICHLSPRGVGIEAYFDERIVHKTHMCMILSQLDCAIRRLAENGEIKLKEIDILDIDTKAQIWQWNETVPIMINACVQDLIGQQYQIQPNAQAVNAWDGELTYAELNEWSTRLAQQLVELVGPKDIVPLYFEKSMWTVVAILGVIKAGAAFVLLDAGQPEARLQSIIDQVNKAHMVLSSTQNIATSSKLAKEVIVVSYTALNKLPKAITTRNLSNNSPEAALYVVFTSGSTGIPKGVVITHATFASAAHYRALLVGFNHTTRILDFGSYSFDASIGNILDSLINGSCLYIPSDTDRLDNLGGYIRRTQITSANLTPTVARQLVPSAVPSLKSLQLVGEPMVQKDIEIWAKHLDLINSYGPAECSVTSTFHSSMSTDTDPRSIGRGVGSVTWVVDPADHERLMPIGAVGELLIEGPVVGQGYLDDPSKTAAAFIEDPPWLLAGGGAGQTGRRGRLYKTGDLVRYHIDGTLIFIGRNNTQVKIHGQRVELGEVEYSIRQRLSNGSEIVAEVIVPAGSTNEPALVVFVKMIPAVDEESKSPGGEVNHLINEKRKDLAQSYLTSQTVRLNNSLSEVLPRYMIPSAYIAVEAIPLTISGKTDRKRLREIGAAMTIEELAVIRAIETTKRVPSTATESVLQRLWSTTLGVAEESIGVNDSFFQLGGDSIRAMKLVAAARTEGLLLSVADIFHRPKLCNMATCRLLDTGAQGQLPFRPFWSLNVPSVEDFLLDVIRPQIKLEHYRIEDVLPTTDFQDYAIRTTHEKPRSKLLYVLMSLPASSSVQRLIAACRALIYRHDALRTVFISHKGSFLQVILANIEVEISVTRTEHDPVIIAKRICTEDVEGELPLGSSCPRFWVIQQGEQGICLILRISHAQYDGIGLPIILQDLQALHQQEPMSSAPSFSTYINSKIQAADSQCKEYWRNLLGGSSMTPLPSQNHDQTALLLEGDHGPSVTLKAVVPMPKLHPSVTLATLISAAWAFVISRTTSHDDVVFGQLTSGRNMSVPSIDNIVGTCINIVPVRLQIQPGKKLSELLSALQDQKIASAQFEFYGLTEIVENCVRWPKKTNFSWIAQHQNIDEVHSLSFADGDSKVEYFAPHSEKNMEDAVWLYTAPLQNALQIVLTGRKLRKGLLEQVLEELKTVLGQGAD